MSEESCKNTNQNSQPFVYFVYFVDKKIACLALTKDGNSLLLIVPLGQSLKLNPKEEPRNTQNTRKYEWGATESNGQVRNSRQSAQSRETGLSTTEFH
jgi:hypothetical protein